MRALRLPFGGTGYISAVSMKLTPSHRVVELPMRVGLGVLLAEGHRAEADLRRGDRPLTDPPRERPRLGGDLAQALLVGVEDGRHDQRFGGGDCDADVDPRVELEAAVAVGAVGFGNSRRAIAQALTIMSLTDGTTSPSPRRL